jgi:Glycosyl transferase family 2
MGLVAGRNVLVESALTDLVVFLDADDRLDPTYIEKTLKAMNTAPDDLGAVLTRRRNFGLNEHESACFLLGSPLHYVFNDFRMTALIKRSILLELRFDPLMRNGEADDWWWWLLFTAHGRKAVQVPESLFHYRQTRTSMSLPWSEGQGALTMLRVCEVVREAAATGRLDARHIAQIAEEAIALAYKRTWECDTLRGQLAARPAVAPTEVGTAMHAAILNARRARMRARLVSLFGDRNTTRLVNVARWIARNQPLASIMAERLLVLWRLNRPYPVSGRF